MTSYVVVANYGKQAICLATFMSLEKAKKYADEEAYRAHNIYGKSDFKESTQSATAIRNYYVLENSEKDRIEVYSVPHDANRPSSYDDGY